MKLKELKSLHIETCKVCNLKCPDCDAWRVPNVMMDYDLALQAIDQATQGVKFCGAEGEPIAHPKFLGMVKRAKEKGLAIEIHTNGTLRTDEWWCELALILNEKDTIKFATDGVNQELYERYRVGGKLDKLYNNHQIFKTYNKDTNTVYKYIMFDYNVEYQKEAERICKEERFTTFEPSAARSNQDWVYEKIDYFIKREKNVECMTKLGHLIYLDARGIVYPCCESVSAVNEYYPSMDKKVLKSGEKIIDLLAREYEDYFDPWQYDCKKRCGKMSLTLQDKLIKGDV